MPDPKKLFLRCVAVGFGALSLGAAPAQAEGFDGVLGLDLHRQVGDEVGGAGSSADRVATITAAADDPEEVLRRLDTAATLLHLSTHRP